MKKKIAHKTPITRGHLGSLVREYGELELKVVEFGKSRYTRLRTLPRFGRMQYCTVLPNGEFRNSCFSDEHFDYQMNIHKMFEYDSRRRRITQIRSDGKIVWMLRK